MKPNQQTISGWGNYPRQPAMLLRPDRRDRLASLMQLHRDQPPDAPHRDGVLIPRGLGRSYGDAATNHNRRVIDTTALRRFIDWRENPDDQTATLTAEAGVSYADLIDILLPRGYFPLVSPGTKFVTLGGAIAADVHGKNHHRLGSFNACVDAFSLLTPTGQTLNCSRTENADVFWASFGGMGLTGIIQTATIRLRKVSSAYVDVATTRVPDLDTMLAHFTQTDDDTTYSVAWIDCLASGARLGRGVVLQGEHAAEGGLELPSQSSKTVPFDFPGFALNPLSVRAFNATYYATHKTGRSREDINTYFYPLDAVHHWNRIYGKRGFVQYQPVFPEADGSAGIRAVIEALAAQGCSSFLAVLKQMGGHATGPIGFPIKGLTLAVDMPRVSGLDDLLARLDRIVLDHGGRVYLAKDASLSPQTFRAMYPDLDRFLAVRERLDPQGVLSSDQSRRLGITR